MRIPTSTSLNRRIPSGSTGIDTSHNDYGLNQVAGFVNNIHERRTAYATANAQANFLKAKLAQDNGYDQDDDYSTINDRYNQGVTAALDEAAVSIKDKQARAEFVRNNQLRIEEGRHRINKLAFGKERDSNRASIDEQLEGLREVGVSGNIEDAFTSGSDILDNAAALGYYSEEEAGDVRRAFRDKLAVSRLESLPADEQIKALKEPWAKNIAASTRGKLIDAARQDQRRSSAIKAVDDIFDRGLDETQALKAIRKIGNDDLRLEVERRYGNQLSRQKSARQERETELSQENFLAVRRGELSVDDIDRDTLEEMTPAQINQLYAAEKSASDTSGKVETSREAFAQFYEHMGKGEVFVARQFVLDNASLFDDGDYESLIRASATKIADTVDKDGPDPAKSVLSVQKELDLRMGQLKLGDTKAKEVKGEVLLAYDRWNKDFQAQNGKEPTDIERSEKMNQMLTRVSYNPAGFGKVKNKFGFKVEDEELGAAVKSYQDRNPKKFQAVVDAFKEEGVDPSLRDFVTRYNERD